MINIGILGCAEIAYRRFMPAALQVSGIKVLAAAEEYAPEKLVSFCDAYGLKAEKSFVDVLQRADISAVYIPLPPALHFQWSERALLSGKHVLIEKPATTDYQRTEKLIHLADASDLAMHENYMFQYHSQLEEIKKIVMQEEIGNVRLIRADFGFPLRKKEDFRYSRKLGGGALLDAGGYVLKLASIFLGKSVKVDAAKLSGLTGYEVDMYGSVSLSNDLGQVCQIGFGMDCYYQCSLQIWGSKGKLTADRIFTAPPDYRPVVVVETAEGRKSVELNEDAHFQHSIEAFLMETKDAAERKKMYGEILLQASLVDAVRRHAG